LNYSNTPSEQILEIIQHNYASDKKRYQMMDASS